MSKRCKAPSGCYWVGDVLYGRIQAGGRDLRWSLRTDDPKTAIQRRKAERDRVIATNYGDHRRTFAEAMEAWGRFIVGKIGEKTLTRYLSSLAVLQPHLEGLFLDEIDKKLIGAIVESRRNTPYIPTGKKHPITVSLATVKRDLTALSSVFDFCVDEDWLSDNPAMAWLKPGHRKKSRLPERRDPIVLPELAHIKMVIERAGGLFGKMIEAAMLTGAREDELAKGVRSHFDQNRRQLTLIGKRNKLRVIELEDAGQDFGFRLFNALPATTETKALFWHRLPEGKRGTREGTSKAYSQVASNFRRIVAAVAKQAQKQAYDFRPFCFHHLRHYHAVQWLKSGRSIYTLQQRLGHTSVKTTEMYLAYLTPDERGKVMFGAEAPGIKSGIRAKVRKGQNFEKPL